MKLPFLAIILGAIFSALGWLLFWKLKEAPPTFDTVETNVPASRFQRSHITDEVLFKRLTSEQEKSAIYEAALDLGGMSRAGLEKSLDAIKDDLESGKLSLAAQLLLIEWGRRAPEEAIAWAWENLRDSRNWPNAFRQIGPQWAWDDPEGFANFLIERRDPGITSGEVLFSHQFTFEELQKLTHPGFRFETIRGCVKWIVKASPREGFKLLRFVHSSSSGVDELTNSLKTSADIDSALSAWDDYSATVDEEVREAYEKNGGLMHGEPREIRRAKLELIHKFHRTRHPREQAQVQMLIKHWKSLDAEGFENSIYREWEK